MKPFLLVVFTVCCHQPLFGQLEFTGPEEVKATNSEITLGLTLVNIKREKTIAELFQVLMTKRIHLSVIDEQEHVDDFVLSLLLHLLLLQEHVDDFVLSLLLHSSGEPIRILVITDHHSLQGG